ncbi:MAG: thiamine phosphate synthase [Candidatus Dormibacteraeota bacterium]|nr:thiamine phosphate synthase [Candidatus Dormibacteraeota bacterium]
MGSPVEDRRERLAQMRLYVITGDRGDAAETLGIVEAALDGGADVIQLRKKAMPKDEQYRLAVSLCEMTRARGALLIVNDHPDLAIAADADGVHLGQDDFPPAMIRALHGFQGRLLGRSTHSLDQAVAATRDGVDYLGVGPVFATPTKADRPPVGTGLVRQVAAAIDRPFVAIGGIDLATAPFVIAAGARALAVVRAVYDAPDPRESARALRQLVEAGEPAVTA